MTDAFGDKLKSLGFSIPNGTTKPSNSLVQKFEKRFELNLPADYRVFLVSHGGARGMAFCELLEPTPFGQTVVIDGFLGFERDEIGNSTDLIEGAPDIIAIGDEPMGMMFWLYCTGSYRGTVLVADHRGRSAWPDEQFRKWFPNLDPSIETYLSLRRSGKLPKKPAGFAHVYLAARTFSEFVNKLTPYSLD